MVELVKVMHDWDHPLTEALVGDEIGIRVVSTLNEAFPGSLEELSLEFLMVESGLLSDSANIVSDEFFGDNSTDKGSVSKFVHFKLISYNFSILLPLNKKENSIIQSYPLGE
jgi:hypothetical protein